MVKGGSKVFNEDIDFKSDFDQFNEECSVQFLIDAIQKNLDHDLKPREVYEQKIAELKVDSMSKYNMLNVYRLHLNERDILDQNLSYLLKMRKNI
jgi:hypothetical protein